MISTYITLKKMYRPNHKEGDCHCSHRYSVDISVSVYRSYKPASDYRKK